MTRLSISLMAFAFLPVLMVLQSCEIAGDTTLNAEDLTVTMVENKEEGATIGQIKATSDAALQFEVLSSSPEGAFAINDRTGLLMIADPTLFDFEVRPSLSAQVNVQADDKSQIVDVMVELEDAQADIEDWNRFTKAWQTTAFYTNTTETSCRMDDLLSISGTGMYTYDRGTDVCENVDMIWQENGTWDLDENLKFVLFDKGTPEEFKADLISFENGVMELNFNWENNSIEAAYNIE